MISHDGITKQCPDCLRTLPVSEFGANKAARDGLACYCRPCFRMRLKGGNEPRLSRGQERVQERLASGLKACSLCHIRKPFSDYYRNAKAPDGYYAYCKHCHVTIVRRYQRAEERAQRLAAKEPNQIPRIDVEKHNHRSDKQHHGDNLHPESEFSDITPKRRLRSR